MNHSGEGRKIQVKKRPLRVRFDKKRKRYYLQFGKKKLWFDTLEDKFKKQLYTYIKEKTVERVKSTYRRRRRARKAKKNTPGAFLNSNGASVISSSSIRPTAVPFNLFFPGFQREMRMIEPDKVQPIDKPEEKAQLKDKERKLISDVEEQKIRELKLLPDPKAKPEGTKLKAIPAPKQTDEEDPEEVKIPLKPTAMDETIVIPKGTEQKKESLKYQPLGVGVPDTYYAKYTSPDENGVDTTKDINIPLDVRSKDLSRNKKSKEIYEILRTNKWANKQTTFKAGDDGFKFFLPFLKKAHNSLPNEKDISEIIISNRSLVSSGSGRALRSKDGGMYDDELNSMLAGWNDYVGCIMRDEIDELLEKSKEEGWDRFGFIVNTKPSTEEGDHWTAIYIDLYGDKSVEFFDPFGDPPHPDVEKSLKQYIDSLKLPFLLKYKVNSNKVQHEKSDRCGLHAALFLEDRFRGKSFAEATGFEQKPKLITESEKRAEKRLERGGFLRAKRGNGFPLI